MEKQKNIQNQSYNLEKQKCGLSRRITHTISVMAGVHYMAEFFLIVIHKHFCTCATEAAFRRVHHDFLPLTFLRRSCGSSAYDFLPAFRP